MTNRILPTLFLLLCFAAGCKKEEGTPKGTIEFDVDGVHQTHKVVFAGIETEGPLGPCVVIRTQAQYSISDFYIYDSLLSSNLLRPKTYTSDSFVLIYNDTLNCEYQSPLLFDNGSANFGTLQVTSCTGYRPVLNATFSATYQYGSGAYNHCYQPKTITNGKITNVYYQVPW